MIWSFKRKRSSIGELLKYKARLCMHEEKQTKGLYCQNTHAPVVQSIIIRLIIVLVIINSQNYQHLDYVLACTQAPCNLELYIKIPTTFYVKNANEEEYYLNLIKNVCRTKKV